MLESSLLNPFSPHRPDAVWDKLYVRVTCANSMRSHPAYPRWFAIDVSVPPADRWALHDVALNEFHRHVGRRTRDSIELAVFDIDRNVVPAEPANQRRYDVHAVFLGARLRPSFRRQRQ